MSINNGLATGVVSVSMAIVATQAMAHSGFQSQQVLSIDASEPLDDTLKSRIEVAVAKEDVRKAVSEMFSVIANHFGENELSLAGKYFGEAGVEDKNLQTASFDDFSSGVGGCYANCHVACYANCHDACYSACHGSRGWR